MSSPGELDATNVRVVVTSVTPEHAHALASALVERRLAACVSILPSARSIYVWDGRVCDEVEAILLCKTTEERLPALSSHLLEAHPYELPELLVLSPEAALAAYGAWVESMVRPDDPEDTP